MEIIREYIEDYIKYCDERKRLNWKTLKAYSIDLCQFASYCCENSIDFTVRVDAGDYIIKLHQRYSVKTVKRKLASLKGFGRYLYEERGFVENYLYHMTTKFREPKKLPKIIELHNIEKLLKAAYYQYEVEFNVSCKNIILRDIVVMELLIGTGMRVSEICNLTLDNIDMVTGTVKIYGKGSKERVLSIGNQDLMDMMVKYFNLFKKEILMEGNVFAHPDGTHISEQLVRRMLKKYARLAGVEQNITPHMFRHSFATLLLEQDVDIRYIQKMLGHSSISVTEIYTYVSSAKQKEILLQKNPRNLLNL